LQTEKTNQLTKKFGVSMRCYPADKTKLRELAYKQGLAEYKDTEADLFHKLIVDYEKKVKK